MAELKLFDISWSSSLSSLKFLFYLMTKSKGLPLKLCEAHESVLGRGNRIDKGETKHGLTEEEFRCDWSVL